MRNSGIRRELLVVGVLVGPLAAFVAASLYPPTASWLRTLGSEPLHGRDVTSEQWPVAFSLLDTNGQRRTLADFRGRAVLLAFGYTRCPDACPTTLARLAQVRRLLGTDADKVQILFVSIDPERDSAALLASYLGAFDPSFIALRGNDRETDAATRAFHADYHIVQYGKEVLVEHTVDTYLIDPRGRVRDVLPYDLTAQDVAQDVHSVLRESGLCSPGGFPGKLPGTGSAA